MRHEPTFSAVPPRRIYKYQLEGVACSDMVGGAGMTRSAVQSISRTVLAVLCLARCASFSIADEPIPGIPTLKAPAKVILKRLNIVVSADGSAITKSHYEFQVLDAKLIDKAKTEIIPLCPPLSTVRVTKTFTRQPDGTTVIVPESAIVTRATKKPSTSECPEEIVITYPDIKLGSIVVRETETKTSAIFSHQFVYALMIQKTQTIDHLQIDLTVPSSMVLTVDAPGVTQSRMASQNTTTYRFDYARPSLTASLEELQARRATSPGIYISSFKNYSDAAKSLGAIFYPKAIITPAIQAKADQIVAGETSRRGRAKRIHDWVKTNIRYVAGPWGDRAPREASAVLSTGTGDCKDQAVLLSALLQSEGIETEFVFLDTLDGSFLPKAPVAWGIFNHVITYLPEFNLYQDTTWADADFGDQPLISYGRVALQANRNGGKTIKFPGELGAGLDRLRAFGQSAQ